MRSFWLACSTTRLCDQLDQLQRVNRYIRSFLSGIVTSNLAIPALAMNLEVDYNEYL